MLQGTSPTFSEEFTSDNGATEPLNESENHCNAENNYYKQLPPSHTDVFKGRNRFAFWVIIALLVVLTLGNLILTLIIIGVLQMGKGMKTIEVIPEEDSIKFFGSADLDRISYKGTNPIEGFVGEPQTITGDGGSVLVKVIRGGQTHSRIILDDSGINIKEVNSFEIKDSKTGDTIFSTHKPHYNIPDGVDKLISSETTTKKITSPINKAFTVKSEDKLYLKGAEGITADGQTLFFMTPENIALNTTLGATVFDAAGGIFLNMDLMPVVKSEFGLRTANLQYKICVCMPQGKLFRVPIPRNHNGAKISCMHFNPKFDPCV